MKYWSEKTRTLYDSAEACQKAEFEAKEKENRERILKEREAREKKEKEEALIAQRKVRAAEIEEARKTMVDAQNNYRKLLEEFTKDYGSYHYTSHSTEDIPIFFSSLFDWFK